MKEMVRNIIIIVSILFFWLLGDLIFDYNEAFYNLLNIPSYALNPNTISIIKFILYILVTISIFKISKTTNILKSYDYLYVLLTNYLASQLYPFMFYTLKSPFFGFIMTSIVFISSIFLYIETKIINKKASYFIIPYAILNIYFLIISLAIYIMNF